MFMNRKQKGFSLFIIIAIIFTVLLACGVGYYVYYRQSHSDNLYLGDKEGNNEYEPGLINICFTAGTPKEKRVEIIGKFTTEVMSVEDDTETNCYNMVRVTEGREQAIINQLKTISEVKSAEREHVFIPALKPIIYLYPTNTEEVKVQLDYKGILTSTYPNYDYAIKGWQAIAHPDGSLINLKDNKPYSYLFWEGVNNNSNYDMSTGYVVKGSDIKDFLQSTLSKIGLTPKEYNEMIVYWLPKMQNNKYNLIHFAGREYTDNAKLTITPKPDSMLRVFMVYKKLNNYQQVKPQVIQPFVRKGFTVIEWGGTEIK